MIESLMRKWKLVLKRCGQGCPRSVIYERFIMTKNGIQFLFIVSLLLTGIIISHETTAKESLDREGIQWFPFLEWSLENPTYTGNPFDLLATVTFTHASGERRSTGMFYAGNDTWKFRFTGTRTGEWTFTTSCEDSDLDGKKGSVIIRRNPNPKAHGFLTHIGNKWAWQGTSKAFVPQLVMYDDPTAFLGNPQKIEKDIETFFVEHGFNGFHTSVLCRWFDLNKTTYDEIESRDPNPDPRTFEALELLISKVHAAGGMVHLWAWGDEQRHMTPVKWGKNGKVDQRLQRYIAARLGPLPGWSMGYGFDLFEWVDEGDLREWHHFLHEQFGWAHLLGGRPGGPRKGTDHSDWQIYDGLDYASYEHHRPTYEVYVAALETNPSKPVFSEDRFRIRYPSRYPEKDYNEELTRRGLWHSAMAGGVANIWGNLLDGGSGAGGSGSYEHPEWIKTYSLFFQNRFMNNMLRDNERTDGVCLKQPSNTHFLFYKEDAEKIRINLEGVNESLRAIAVDAKKRYQEVDIGKLSANDSIWNAPYASDWGLAVGDFGYSSGVKH